MLEIQPYKVLTFEDSDTPSREAFDIIIRRINSALVAVAGEFHAPYIDDATKHWMQWDATAGDYVDTGYVGATYLWIRWSATEPTSDTDVKSTPDAYVGMYYGPSENAPTAYTDYQWYHQKGDTGQQGEQGEPGTGNNWYTGTAITGTSETPAVYATGITTAQVGDMYLNTGTLPDTGRTYRCTLGGDAETALWAFEALLRGADGAGSGDMSKSVYDPTSKAADAFSLANMTGDTTHRTVTDTEKSTWSGKQDALGFTPIPTTQKGAASGVAELDEGGHVPSSQLPSYVDDVLEYASLANFPATGETGKIYVATDTNLSYRWSGSGYVEISPSIALGETSATAYRGDRGKTAYDHSQITTGNPHGLTRTDIGAAEAWAQLTALPTSGTALADKTEYRVSAAVGTHAFAWPTGPFEVWLSFSTDTAVSITFPAGTKYIGGAPTFAVSTDYEMSVKDGVVIVQEVTAS